MWTKLISFIFGASVATTAPAPSYPPPSLDEILTYDCAKVVADVVGNGPQIGPVFAQGGLVFTSLSNARGERLLLLDAGAGIFTVPLSAIGLNRIQFSAPSGNKGEHRRYFLGYIHGDRYRSRVTEFSMSRAPIGRDEIDYLAVNIRRSESLLAHLEYSIFQTTQATLSAMADKRVTRQDLNVIQTESCDHIARTSPALARNLQFDFTLITREILGAKKVAATSGRMPASVPKIFKQN